MRFRQLAAIFSVVSIVFVLFAEVTAAESEKKERGAPYESSISIIPGVGYTPETSFLVGGFFTYQFKPPRTGEETRASKIDVSAVYTFEHHALLTVEPAIMTPSETWTLDGFYEFQRYPNSLWPLGPNSRSDSRVDIEYIDLRLEQKILRRLVGTLKVGPKIGFWYNNGFRTQIPSGSSLSTANGLSGVRAFKIGLSIRSDTRDSLTYTTSGYFTEFDVSVSPDLFGTNPAYGTATIDLRGYIDLADNGKDILAGQALFEASTSKTPILAKPELGGENALRGYQEGRYRDNYTTELQVEYRRDLPWRFSAVAFGGIGEVWPSFQRMDFSQPKWAVGGGLRFDLNPEDTFNLRVDYAVGRRSQAFYILGGEAF